MSHSRGGGSLKFRRAVSSLLRKQSTQKRDATVLESGARAGARTYCCRKFLESEIIDEGVGYFSPKPNNI